MSHWKACISTIDTTLLDISYSRVVFSDPSMGKGYSSPYNPILGGGGGGFPNALYRFDVNQGRNSRVLVAP